MNYAAVGAFVLLLAAALVAAVLWLASGGGSRRHVVLYGAVEQESVAGLSLNAPVKYNGVDVGTVREIQLDASHPEQVNLVLAIYQGTPIKGDTVAVLKTQGLTGIAYMELSGGTPGSPPPQAASEGAYPMIRTKPSLGARLEDVLTTVLIKLDASTSRFDALLSQRNEQAVSHALADIATLAHTLAARQPTIDAGLRDAGRTLAHSARLSAQLETSLPAAVSRFVAAADALQHAGSEAALASGLAGSAVLRVGADVQRFGAQTLPEVQQLLGELNTLSASLRRLVEQAERDPAGLLLRRAVVPDGPGEAPLNGQPPEATTPLQQPLREHR